MHFEGIIKLRAVRHRREVLQVHFYNILNTYTTAKGTKAPHGHGDMSLVEQLFSQITVGRQKKICQPRCMPDQETLPLPVGCLPTSDP